MKHLISTTLFLCCSIAIHAQGVKISPQSGTPNPSAILETQDSTRGVLLPRGEERNFITYQEDLKTKKAVERNH